MSGIFSFITRRGIFTRKNISPNSELYLYVLFPITVSFLATFIGARVLSYFRPSFFVPLIENVHVHHFAYGIIILSACCYLALVNNGPRSKYIIALLYGIGLGLIFDEFEMWLLLSDHDSARWSYDGLVVLVAFFILMISGESGTRMWRRHFGKNRIQ